MRNDDFKTIRLIPGMNFTCNGIITNVTVAGELPPNQGHQGPRPVIKLHVWKEDTSESGIYHKSRNIVLSLDLCIKRQLNQVYDCQLPMMMQVSVEPGDILGIELPRRGATISELSEPQLTNHIFRSRRNHPDPFIINLNETNETDSPQPLIRIRITNYYSSGISANISKIYYIQ